MFTPEQIKNLQKASTDFVFFVNNIFSLSEKVFTGGEYVDDTARFLSQHKKTIRVSARNHFKSFSLYAHFMWKLLFEASANPVEAHYMSFNQDLAGYHVGKIRQAIQKNPYYADLKDMKPTAETTLKYTWDGTNYITLSPHGLIQFKRGIHADIIYLDDPFQDPENEMNPVVIRKINEVFKSNILDMPKEPDGELHIAGTAQTNDDFYFDKIITRRFAVRIQPAINNDGTALWPEWMNIDELNRKKEERTERIFKREYMCQPVLSTKAFFNKEKIVENIVNKDLSNLSIRVKQRHSTSLVIAGFDIGKKTHPSHLSVFQLVNNRLIMLHHTFMDGWSYSNGKEFYDSAPTQLEYLKLAIENFGIHELYYDNTRGEFESFVEQGLLPRQMIPVVFTSKLKNTSATSFDRLVEKKQMEIVNDDRLISQICAVTGDLQAAATPQGHGDCYDDQTEILTESGWKFFKDVSYDDKVATLKDQKYLEYQKPTNIINEKYDGKMYEIATKQVNLLVTPRHKLFVNKYTQRKKKNYELLNPHKIEGKQIAYKKDAEWSGHEKEYFEFENIKIKMDDFLKFIGYYVSEGYTYRDKALIICQKSSWKSEQMYNDLKKLPFNVKQKNKKISDKYGYDGSIYFFSTVLTKWSKQYLGTPSINKQLPKWILSLSARQLRILLDALVLGDGTYSWWPNIKSTASSYTTISKKLADQIQEITLKIGWSSNIRFSDNNIGRKGMFGTGKHRVYTITFILKKNQPIVHKYKKSDRWIDYSGNIHCVTVPNHVIYVRRNGKPVWSGNSYWSVALVAKGVIDRIGYNDSDFPGHLRRRVSTGSKSLFTEGAAIPRNW